MDKIRLCKSLTIIAFLDMIKPHIVWVTMNKTEQNIKSEQKCEHHWISHGKTQSGKKRYKCTKCGKTRVEITEEVVKKCFDINLALIHSHKSLKSHVWYEALDFDWQSGTYDLIETANYDIVKENITWKNFQRLIRNKKLSPLIVYGIEQKAMPENAKLCIFEVIVNNEPK